MIAPNPRRTTAPLSGAVQPADAALARMSERMDHVTDTIGSAILTARRIEAETEGAVGSLLTDLCRVQAALADELLRLAREIVSPVGETTEPGAVGLTHCFDEGFALDVRADLPPLRAGDTLWVGPDGSATRERGGAA